MIYKVVEGCMVFPGFVVVIFLFGGEINPFGAQNDGDSTFACGMCEENMWQTVSWSSF